LLIERSHNNQQTGDDRMTVKWRTHDKTHDKDMPWRSDWAW